MNTDEQYIEEIITRDLHNAATGDQLKTLRQWMEADSNNKQKYEDMRKIWEESSSVLLRHPFNVDRAWEKISKQTERPDTLHGKVFRLHGWKKMAAAAVLLLVSLSALVHYLADGSDSIEVIADKSNKRVSLPDGSIVSLRKGSSVTYDSDFGSNTRSMQLIGEAYFQIKPDATKPFRITTLKTVVEVLGTSFLVRSGDAIEEVIVTSGKVKFSDRIHPDRKVILTKGERCELTGERLIEDRVYNSNHLAWETGVLRFDNTPLQKVLQDVNRYYNVNVVPSEKVKSQGDKVRITAKFDKQTLNEVLEEIQLTTGLIIKHQDNKIILQAP